MTHKQTTFKRRKLIQNAVSVGRWLSVVTWSNIIIFWLSIIYFHTQNVLAIPAVLSAINTGLLIRYENKISGYL